MEKWNLTPITLMFISTTLSMSMKNWMLMWLIMEMSTLSFILNLLTEKSKEKLMAYFLFQSMASIMVIMYMFKEDSWTNYTKTQMNTMMVLLAIMLKTGVFPFHLWLLEMSKFLSWMNISLMMTWQKIIPLIFLLKCSKHTYVENPTLVFMLSMIIVMMSMSSIKKILMSSSSVHMGWMILSMKFFKVTMMMYMLMYSTIILVLNVLLMKNNMKSIFYSLKNKTNTTNLNTLMFSLAGIPPSAGFFIKLMVLMSLIKMNSKKEIIIAVMVISSLSFTVYFKMFYKSINYMKNYFTSKSMMIKNQSTKMSWVNFTLPILLVN